MTRRVISSFVTLACVAVTLGVLGNRNFAAEKAPSRFQAFSQDHGVRFVAGPYAPGTLLSITSLTVAAPFHSTNVGLRLFHGLAGACDALAIADAQLFVAVLQGDTAHLAFPQPLVVTHPTQTFCMSIEQLATEFSQVTIVGFTG